MKRLLNHQKWRLIERGIHSGFSSCCIQYYLLRSQYVPEQIKIKSIKLRRKFGIKSKGYIRCPKCVLFGRIVEVHKCNVRCHGEVGHCQTKCFICHREALGEKWVKT